MLPSPEMVQYQKRAKQEAEHVDGCDEAIEFFEKQAQGYGDQLKKFSDDLDVPDASVAELEENLLDCQHRALNFEEEAHGREREIVYLIDAMIDVLLDSAPGGQLTPPQQMDKRNLEQNRRVHEQLAHKRRDRTKKREEQIKKQRADAERLLDARHKEEQEIAAKQQANPSSARRRAKPVFRVAPVRDWRRKAVAIHPQPIRRPRRPSQPSPGN
jgi:hypothetical protein